jgi:uridine kinase
MAELNAVCGTLTQLIASWRAQGCAPLLVGIGGPGGAGKSTLCQALAKQQPDWRILATDDYRKPRSARAATGLRGSHPQANDVALLCEHLAAIKEGHVIRPPCYDSVAGTVSTGDRLHIAAVLLVDGEAVLFEAVRPQLDRLIYVDADWEAIIAARLARDQQRYGHSREKALATLEISNRQDFPRFSAPRKATADVIVHRDHVGGWRIVKH